MVETFRVSAVHLGSILGVLREAPPSVLSLFRSYVIAGWEASTKASKGTYADDTISLQWRQHAVSHGRKMYKAPRAPSQTAISSLANISALNHPSTQTPPTVTIWHFRYLTYSLSASASDLTKFKTPKDGSHSSDIALINHHAEPDRLQGLKRWGPQTVHNSKARPTRR